MASASRKTASGCSVRLFGIFWTAFSLIFVAVGLWQAGKALSSRGWEKVPCVIEKFEIVPDAENAGEFRADLSYRYEVGGDSFTGTRLWSHKESSDSYEDLSEIRESLLQGPEGTLPSPAGVTTECRVNPSDPDESRLAEGSGGQLSFGLAFAAFGGLFVLIGLALIFGKAGGEKAPTSAAKEQASSSPAILFFLIFGLAGLGIFCGLVIPKALEWADMRGWKETPAEIIRSRLASRSDSDGTVYSIDLFYRYTVNGREHRSNRYGLIGGSSSGRKGKQAVVSAHPPGSALTVFVDPDEPWRAVVKRDPGWGALLALFPLPFMAVGFGGLWWTLKKRAKKAPVSSRRAAPAPRQIGSAPLAAGEWARLRTVPLGGFVIVLVFALFWNGFIGFALRDNLQDFGRGGGGAWIGGVFSLFLIPFILVGLGLLAAVVYMFLALFGPVFELSIDEAALLPGAATSVRWRRAGGWGQPRSFTLLLVGREEATYQNGSSSSTAKSVFHEQVIFETTVPAATERGHATLAIPQEAVPTFNGRNNRIRWLIDLRAGVPRLPDVNAERELLVHAPVREEQP